MVSFRSKIFVILAVLAVNGAALYGLYRLFEKNFSPPSSTNVKIDPIEAFHKLEAEIRSTFLKCDYRLEIKNNESFQELLFDPPFDKDYAIEFDRLSRPGRIIAEKGRKISGGITIENLQLSRKKKDQSQAHGALTRFLVRLNVVGKAADGKRLQLDPALEYFIYADVMGKIVLCPEKALPSLSKSICGKSVALHTHKGAGKYIDLDLFAFDSEKNEFISGAYKTLGPDEFENYEVKRVFVGKSDFYIERMKSLPRDEILPPPLFADFIDKEILLLQKTKKSGLQLIRTKNRINHLPIAYTFDEAVTTIASNRFSKKVVVLTGKKEMGSQLQLLKYDSYNQYLKKLDNLEIGAPQLSSELADLQWSTKDQNKALLTYVDISEKESQLVSRLVSTENDEIYFHVKNQITIPKPVWLKTAVLQAGHYLVIVFKDSDGRGRLKIGRIDYEVNDIELSESFTFEENLDEHPLKIISLSANKAHLFYGINQNKILFIDRNGSPSFHKGLDVNSDGLVLTETVRHLPQTNQYFMLWKTNKQVGASVVCLGPKNKQVR